ncbi:MAG: single-stranded DNA-binding protein [Lawsonibacter sp.]|nr:single-stranded DNA-binding protein [Lawsonibacter sp.]
MLNHITVMGRLTRDPELRRTQAGVPVASFSIACDRDFKDKSTGERATDFIDIVAWRSTGEFASKYLTKGRMAVVSGRLQMRDWTDKEGNKRRSAEIIAENIYFGDSKTKEDQEPPASSGGPVEAAGGDPFGGLPDGFAPNFGEPADDGSLPF